MISIAFIVSLGLLAANTQATPIQPVTQAMVQADEIRSETIHAEFRKEIVIVPCTVADVPALKCVLDTGSSMTGLSPELVKKLNLHPVSEPGAASSTPLAYTLLPQMVQLGVNTFRAERVGMAPLDIVSKAVGEKVDALLGTSVFEQLQITIDPQALEVRIAAPGTAVTRPVASQQIIMPNHVPVGFVLMKTVDGKGLAVPMHMDTGSMPALLLSKPFFDAHPVIATGNRSVRSNDVLFTINVMRFGAEFHDVPAGEPVPPTGVLASKLTGGYLGAPVLNRMIITYDLGRSAMYTSNLPDSARPFEPPPQVQ